MTEPPQARTATIMRLRNEGKTFAQIGEVVGLSKQRVWSIINREETLALMDEVMADTLDT